ncbi:hypothetical protein [Rugamonas sp.]|uniref:hypothetical protein n=1 Tax=Rugamonas sp. TaxID=1926287 RepID=UPI0025D8183F|nr:hypothetical protein [Rugamonas sp.]
MLRKQLFYLTSEQLCAYQWDGKALSDGVCFGHERDGLDAFLDYVDEHANVPAYLMADLIEEDFQRVLLPHVGPRARRNMLERRLLQQYRDTPYRHAAIQGRDTEGRRDDIALLSALTNPAVVTPWIAALETLKVPLAGLYSTTLMSAELVKRLALKNEHLLLVTQQSGGLRQSYFHRGQLKFSRLTPDHERDGAALALSTETDKTQQFLTSIRLLERGAILRTVIVTPAAQIAALRPLCVDGPETSYHFIAMDKAAAKIGLAHAPTLADALLLQLLGKGGPDSHYRLGPARRYYALWRARLALYGVSAVVMACAVLWVAANLWRYVDASNSAERMSGEAAQYDNRYRGSMSSMPPAVDKTANMKAAVTLEHMVGAQAPGPLAMMTLLSRALDNTPQVRLNQLDWRVDLPGVAPQASAQSQGGIDAELTAPIAAALFGIPGAPPQTLRVDAEIVVTQHDYRTVVDSMNQFTQELARQPHLTVAIEKLPLDTRSTVKLSGKAGASAASAGADDNAKFTLNLQWKP